MRTHEAVTKINEKPFDQKYRHIMITAESYV